MTVLLRLCRCHERNDSCFSPIVEQNHGIFTDWRKSYGNQRWGVRYFPSHAIQIRTGEFVICDVLHRDHRIVKLSRKWDLVRDFRKPCNSEMSDALKMPQYLIGAGNDYILVADQANNRILLMDIYLELVKELTLPRHEKGETHDKTPTLPDKTPTFPDETPISFRGDLKTPFRMCLDQSNRRLFFVAEENQNEVKIFSF